MAILKLNDLIVGYGKTPVLSKLNLEINKGELLSILGPSGVGKTTLLKTVAGLHPPLAGAIHIDEEEVTRQPAEKRDIVLLFQKPLLFPFLNVFENIAFGLKMAKVKEMEISQRVLQVMELTEIGHLSQRIPADLSGGQQQRVALARALVLQPSILLLDEPFSSLDADLRKKMQDLVRDLQRQTGTTMLFVTHDQSEAFTISDRIALMLDGEIIQVAPPSQLFSFPRIPEVASFLGNPNIIFGHIKNDILFFDQHTIPVDRPDQPSCTCTIRPEHIHVSSHEKQGAIPATLVEHYFEGPLTRLILRINSSQLTALCLTRPFQNNDRLWLSIEKENIHFF